MNRSNCFFSPVDFAVILCQINLDFSNINLSNKCSSMWFMRSGDLKRQPIRKHNWLGNHFTFQMEQSSHRSNKDSPGSTPAKCGSISSDRLWENDRNVKSLQITDKFVKRLYLILLCLVCFVLICLNYLLIFFWSVRCNTILFRKHRIVHSLYTNGQYIDIPF